MLSEISQIHIGDTEASVLPLVQRYGGSKWTLEPLLPRDQWLDKDEYDYQQNRVSDCRYALLIDPFGNAGVRTGRLVQAMRRVRSAVPRRFRPILGMRDWFAEGELSLRDGRVQSVLAVTVFAGRSGWLGHRWELSEGMPHHEIRPRVYVIGEAFLTMAGGGGTVVENFFTPDASEEKAEAARQFNTGCLTSIKGCDGLCDVAPRAFEYLRQHPDVAWNITPPKCP